MTDFEKVIDFKNMYKAYRKSKSGNKNLTKPHNMTDEECKSLWVYTDGQVCISCWKMTLRQRVSALIFGKVWLGVLSGFTQPPVWVDCTKTVFYSTDKSGAKMDG